MSVRNTPDRKTGLSPHEILMGRAMRFPAVPANALLNITDDMVLDYCKGLADVVRSFSHQVEATTLPPIQGPGHALKAGDWVVIKKHVRKSCLEPCWKGPFQVILTTTTAVKCAGVPNWIHASHTKRVKCPTEEEVEALKSPVTDKKVPDTETEQGEPGGEQAEIEEGEIFSEEEAVDPFEEVGGETSESDKDLEGDEEPAIGGGVGEPAQRRAFPEANDIDKEKENLIDLLGEEKEVGQGEIVQPLPEPVAGPSGYITQGSKMKGVILTPAVRDRRGQGRREHRRQTGGAPQGILTAAVRPRSDAGNRRSPAGFPLPCRILHGSGARSAAMGILTPPTAILFLAGLPPGTGWR
ncbi:hypothetical protein NDU88_001658 [Pleurodeles waltl]|uniref:Murine leukemia virus integrase C-terminal domain-containing protein n=1 Tax=Pleurodeles waltl TaxID=8319 RepID=A0AAV7UXC6_PLEWA|nr:hypothetical protein NDU88_001658 [Pleurodeles waltl]